jgi:integrase
METFEQFATRWKETILPLKKRASQATMGSHIRLLNGRLGNCPLPDISYAMVQKMFTDLTTELQPRSIKNIFGTFRNLMGHATKEGLITEYPKPVLPKIRKTAQDWLRLAEMRAIIKAANDKHRPFVSLLCEVGPRVAEAMGLKAEDLTDQTLHIQRSIYQSQEQDPKTDNAVRKLYISENLRDMLKSCAKTGYFFKTRVGTPWYQTETRRYLDPLLMSLNIQPVGYHAYRRGCASALASDIGMPTKILGGRLGHSHSGDLTLGVYAQIIHGADKPYIDKYAKELYGG